MSITLHKKSSNFNHVSFKGRMSKGKKFRGSYAWQKARKAVKTKYPLCMSLKHCDKPIIATQVHHIIPIDEDEDLKLHEDNLVPLCTHCHEEMTALEKKGRNTKYLFKDWQNRRPENAVRNNRSEQQG